MLDECAQCIIILFFFFEILQLLRGAFLTADRDDLQRQKVRRLAE